MANREQIEKRVINAAESALYHQQHVSPIDVLIGMGWLESSKVQDWHQGRISCLERGVQTSLSKISYAMKCFRSWARKKGLKPSKTVYLARTRGPKRELRFSVSNNPAIEEQYCTHYISPILSEKKQELLKENIEKSPDAVVFIILNNSECSQCKAVLTKGSFLYKEVDQAFCLACAKVDHLAYLPSGDAKLTRWAKKGSTTSAIVVKFSRARNRYERQGVLVEEESLKKAKERLNAESDDDEPNWHEEFMNPTPYY